MFKKITLGVALASSIVLFQPEVSHAEEGVAEPSSQSEVVEPEREQIRKWVARKEPTIAKDIYNDFKNDNKYEIRWGDTLSFIGRVVDEDVQSIADRHNIDNPDLIFEGDHLTFDKDVINQRIVRLVNINDSDKENKENVDEEKADQKEVEQTNEEEAKKGNALTDFIQSLPKVKWLEKFKGN